MTDNELLALARESPQRGHRAIFEKYCNYVYAIAANRLRNVGSREDIEECMSDVFAEVFGNLEKNFDGGLKSYIAVTAKRNAIDFYRKISAKNSHTAEIDETELYMLHSSENIAENAEIFEQREIILRKIKELGEPDATIIIQQYFYGRTAKEIAKSVSLTAGAVQKRSSRARQKLKDLLIEAEIYL